MSINKEAIRTIEGDYAVVRISFKNLTEFEMYLQSNPPVNKKIFTNQMSLRANKEFAGESLEQAISYCHGGYRENFGKYAMDKTIAMIQKVIDEAKPVNTFFTIESMPWMIPTGPQEYLQLLRDVDRDRFAAHLDIINMINNPQRYFFSDEFIDECFEILGPYIKSCHLKDIRLLDDYTFQLKECACGEGSFNYVKYMRAADKINPDMPMIIEHLKNDNEYAESVGKVLTDYNG